MGASKKLLILLLVVSFTVIAGSQNAYAVDILNQVDATAVLIAGLSTNFSILTGLVVMGSVTFLALYYSAKKRNPENY